MKTERFRLALRELKPADWERFEQLASIFLAAEFNDLRTLAASSGDGGRDAILFTPRAHPSVVIQYSVTDEWRKKIRGTIQRLQEKFPDQARVLVYATNQRIGADADELRSELLKKQNLHLDIRDLNWFLERVNADAQREQAAEDLATVVVDPFLVGEGIITAQPRALTTAESRAGLLYLTLQWEDDTREKGLTRLSFEALAKAALRGTDSTRRMTRLQVSDRVAAMVPNHKRSTVDQHVNSALSRMEKQAVRHWTKEDEFCLTYEEQQRLLERLTELELADDAFEDELKNVLVSQAQLIDMKVGECIPTLLSRARSLVDQMLLSRGEFFAQAVLTGDLGRFDVSSLRDLVITEVAKNGDEKLGGKIIDLFISTVERLIRSGGEATQTFLRRFSDAYTLFAFLRETPDVQGAITKMFSHGEIWLDTIIVLPVLAETLFDDEEQRRFTKLLQAASESGLTLYITNGVLEEIERHFNRCITCLDSRGWQGRIPFILDAYASSGRPLDSFRQWLETFAGSARPADDIAAYLLEEFGIAVRSLETEAKRASLELRSAAEEFWHEAHDRRRKSSPVEIDAITLKRLVSHDVENYVGVIERRTQERDSPLGYTTWWLTLDPTAFGMNNALKNRLVGRVPDSPVISPDFFVNYLAIGPSRAKLGKATERQLPISLDSSLFEAPPDILRVASKVREESANLPERVIARRVRDALDQAKRRSGIFAKEGIAGAERSIKETLQKTAKATNVNPVINRESR